ncbi:hypothetical protein DFH28DRAFT_1111080 [Melampsora americana]|nr:hypothetical protein DFH28DRAFT_1111080 [Melampsora americana]
MSQGGSAPYDYGSHGNGPPAFRGPLNPNDLSSNPYNVDSFVPRDGRSNPYSGSSNGHGNSLPQRFPNPNCGFQQSDHHSHQSISPSNDHNSTGHQSNSTQSELLPVFDTHATQANLNTKNQEHARICSNRLENDPRLNTLLVYTAQCHQEIIQRLGQLTGSGPSPNLPSTTTSTTSVPVWKPRDELKKFCVDVLLESITDPNLQAYTLTEGVISVSGEKKTLTHSLEMIIQIRLQQQESSWKTRNFPPASTTRFSKELITFIKTKSKIVRESLHNILLHNACPNCGYVENPLPTLPDIYLSMADFPGLDKRTATDEEVIAEATNNLAKRSRYAYLRMQAVFLEVSTQGNGSSIWRAVDQHLGLLQLNGARFTEAFYKLILDKDKRIFNGQNKLADIKKLANFKIPDNEAVTVAVAALSQPLSSEPNADATRA